MDSSIFLTLASVVDGMSASSSAFPFFWLCLVLVVCFHLLSLFLEVGNW